MPGNNLLLLALKTYKLRPTFFFPSAMRARMRMKMMARAMVRMVRVTMEEVRSIVRINLHCV